MIEPSTRPLPHGSTTLCRLQALNKGCPAPALHIHTAQRRQLRDGLGDLALQHRLRLQADVNESVLLQAGGRVQGSWDLFGRRRCEEAAPAGRRRWRCSLIVWDLTSRVTVLRTSSTAKRVEDSVTGEPCACCSRSRAGRDQGCAGNNRSNSLARRTGDGAHLSGMLCPHSASSHRADRQRETAYEALHGARLAEALSEMPLMLTRRTDL